MKADWSTVMCCRLYSLKMVCPRAHVDVQDFPWGILGASLVPPWCLLGASLVHPCTHWLGPTACFGPLISPRILIPSQPGPNLVACGTNLVQCRVNLNQLGTIFGQPRSHLVLTWVILSPIATKGVSKIIVFPLVFQCFWYVSLHTISLSTCDNSNPIWT